VKRHYFIDNKYLGFSEVPTKLQWGFNILWFCQQCGEVYGREQVEDRPHRPAPWLSRQGCCKKCTPEYPMQYWVPGSIWSLHPIHNKDLPEMVLAHELQMHLKQYDKEAKCRSLISLASM